MFSSLDVLLHSGVVESTQSIHALRFIYYARY